MVWACWPRSARVSLSVAFAVLRRWRLPCMMLAISPNGGKMIQRAILIRPCRVPAHARSVRVCDAGTPASGAYGLPVSPRLISWIGRSGVHLVPWA